VPAVVMRGHSALVQLISNAANLAEARRVGGEPLITALRRSSGTK
jgi:hypothetical protein